MNRTFVDTSFLLALAIQDDELHDRAMAWRKSAVGSLVTTEFVFLEFLDAMAKPGDKELALQAVEILRNTSAVEIIPLSTSLLDEGISWMRLHDDKGRGITDCISFHVMRERNMRAALTHDRHFEQAGFEALLRQDPP